MQVSARNTFSGKVSAVRPGAINDEIELALDNGEKIVATVTRESTRSLGLTEGKEAFAIVKASLVIIMADADEYLLSTRNQFTGKVKKLTRGFVNGEVTLELPGGMEVTAIISLDGVNRLRLEQGATATAIVKASSVIVAVKK